MNRTRLEKRVEDIFLKVRPNNSQELDIWVDAIKTYANDPLVGLYKIKGLLRLQEYIDAEINKARFNMQTIGRTRPTPPKLLEWIELVKDTAKRENIIPREAMKICKKQWAERKMLNKNNDTVQSEKVVTS